jgi:predicted MFS family arabinose efflux permease
MEKNIEDVYSKGLSLQDIEGFDEYLNSIKDSLPEIEDVSLVPSRELNLQNAHNLSKIKATVSAEYINQQMLRIILDLLTVLVISILFMIEITLLAVIIMTRDRSKAKSDQEIDPDVRTSHGLVRSLVFFVNLSGCMALTFIPVVMNSIYQPFMGLPKDVILGLPLSAEMLGGVLAIILAGRLIDRKGWRSVLFIGVLFLAVGNLLSGLSSTVLPYILSRAVAGLGLGYILMTTRSLAVSLPERNLAIAEFGAGSIAGLNCGAVIGGMLADRLGYDAVFFLAAVSAIVPFIFVRRLMIGFEIEKRETSDVSALAKFVNIIADKKAIIFLACIFIPFFISGAFLDYFFPLLLSSNDFSQSDISRGVLLYGLFIIYLGPVLTKLSTEKLGTTNGIIVSMIIVISGLATFMLFGTVAAAFVTIICLGIAESFGVSLETSYFLNLKGIKDLEINKGVAYFSFLVNLSRMAGPIVYGMALLLGMKMGVGVISLVLIVLLFGFIFSIRYMRSQSNTLEVS